MPVQDSVAGDMVSCCLNQSPYVNGTGGEVTDASII